MKTKGYSIWLIPQDKKIYRVYYQIIKKFSKRYHSVIFTPHVTLLGSINGSEVDIINNTRQLAVLLSPYNISFTSLDLEDFFFRSLYIKARQSQEVMEANQKARELFGSKADYMPHLSLLYCDLSQGAKRAIIKSLNRIKWPGFLIDRLFLYRCDGEVKDWQKVQEFTFGEI